MENKIHTQYLYELNSWRAYDDNYDGAPDSNSPLGQGDTEQAAINDLIEQQAERKK